MHGHKKIMWISENRLNIAKICGCRAVVTTHDRKIALIRERNCLKQLKGKRQTKKKRNNIQAVLVPELIWMSWDDISGIWNLISVPHVFSLSAGKHVPLIPSKFFILSLVSPPFLRHISRYILVEILACLRSCIQKLSLFPYNKWGFSRFSSS